MAVQGRVVSKERNDAAKALVGKGAQRSQCRLITRRNSCEKYDFGDALTGGKASVGKVAHVTYSTKYSVPLRTITAPKP